MISYINGHITELSPTHSTIETNGAGYGVFISLIKFTALQGKENSKLFVEKIGVLPRKSSKTLKISIFLTIMQEIYIKTK